MTGKRILVVDDDNIIRVTLSECLANFDHEVLVAESGEEAIEICGKSPVDLAILDYRLPGVSGLEVATIIRSRHGVPFIFLTASDDEEIMRAALDEGAHGYLVKPLKMSDVIPAVEAALKRSEDVRHMARAITETRLINVAIGILMVKHELTMEDAAAHLRLICRPRRIKAAEAGKEIVRAYDEFATSKHRLGAACDLKPEKNSE